MVTIGKKRAFQGRKAEAVNLLIFLVPEVGIEPTWACGPRDFESIPNYQAISHHFQRLINQSLTGPTLE